MSAHPVVTVVLRLPNALPADAVGEAMRAFLDRLGLVQGSATYEALRQLTVTAHWASDAARERGALSHLCAEPGCSRYPAVRLDGQDFCGVHAGRRMREEGPRADTGD